MGSWGHGGWEDDVALDWIDKVITKSKIGTAIEKTLSIGPKDPGYNVLKTRAATTLLIMLGKTYSIPQIDELHTLAIRRLKEVRRIWANDKQNNPETIEELLSWIDKEILVLNNRLQPDKAKNISDEVSEWWTEWL